MLCLYWLISSAQAYSVEHMVGMSWQKQMSNPALASASQKHYGLRAGMPCVHFFSSYDDHVNMMLPTLWLKVHKARSCHQRTL